MHGRWHTCVLLGSSNAKLPRHPPLPALSSFCTASEQEWSGLQAWRDGSLDERRQWGDKGGGVKIGSQGDEGHTLIERMRRDGVKIIPSSLSEWGALILNTPDPALKASFTHHAYNLWYNKKLPLGTAVAPPQPARPLKPVLVPLKQVPDIKTSPLPRSAHALHVLAHIELNAVDLAWDTVVRFSGNSGILGHQFFSDFAHVADDESRHFSWCTQRLSELGFCYGDMPAHNMLISEGQKSASNVMSRLAVVPMVQEARGLDAGPKLAERLVGWGDVRSAGIVNQISEEELAHVAVGVSWFLTVCKMMKKTPSTTFRELLRDLNVEVKGPFNHLARAKAGLPRSWYDPVKPDCASTVEESVPSASQGSIHNSFSLEQEPEISKLNGSDRLNEVYNRLEYIVAMEKENAS